MSEPRLITTDTAKLKQRLTAVVDAIRDTLESLVGQPLEIEPQEFQQIDAGDLCRRKDDFVILLTVGLGESAALRILLPLAQALTINALLAGAEHEELAERSAQGTWEDSDRDSFDVVAKALGTAIDGVVVDYPDPVNRVVETRHELVEPGDSPSTGPLVCCPCRTRIGEHPEATIRVAIDALAADIWNEAPIPTEKPEHEEESLDDIPEAPIRGKLSAYLAKSDPWRTLRRSCRRVGLELQRRARAEVPNPAAHRGELVLMDVPVGEERRFGWSKRLKEFHDDVTVVLLVHAPSRTRVLQGFMAKADVILGWPVEEAELSRKLAHVLEPDGPPEDEESDES